MAWEARSGLKPICCRVWVSGRKFRLNGLGSPLEGRLYSLSRVRQKENEHEGTELLAPHPRLNHGIEILAGLQKEKWGMQHLRSRKIWILLVVIVLLIGVPISVLVIRSLHSSYSSPDPFCSKPENGDGVIDSTDRSSGYEVLKLYDPAQKTFPAGSGRVNLLVRVDSSTRIFRQQGTGCQVLQRVSLRDLSVGQKLKVWSKSGIVLTTYPAQLTDPSDIVIVA